MEHHLRNLNFKITNVILLLSALTFLNCIGQPDKSEVKDPTPQTNPSNGLKKQKNSIELFNSDGQNCWSRMDTTNVGVEDYYSSKMDDYEEYANLLTEPFIGIKDTLIGKNTEHFRTYLGTLKDLKNGEKYHVLTDFWTIQLAISKKKLLAKEKEDTSLYKAEYKNNVLNIVIHHKNEGFDIANRILAFDYEKQT